MDEKNIPEGTGRVREGAVVSGLVSAVIPTRNRAELVVEAIESLLASDYPQIEIIVVDDGSTDNTQSRLEHLAKSCPNASLTLLYQDHAGQAAARNRGIACARGEYIYFLDSDDLVLESGLSAMTAPLAKGAPYAVAQIAEADRNGRRIFAEGASASRIDDHTVIGSQWATHAALYRSDSIRKAGLFNESLSLGEDKEFLWRMVAANPGGIQSDAVVALRRNHTLGQLSDGFTPLIMGRSTLSSLGAFVDWSQRHGTMDRARARAALAPLAIATVRLGAASHMEKKDEAVALMRRLLAISPSPKWRIAADILAKLPRGGFTALAWVMSTARAALHARRNRQHRRTLSQQGI